MLREVFLVFLSANLILALSVKASKKMSYKSPDGGQSMWFEKSSSADLDSSASGYIYNNDGLGPATILHLNSHPVAQAFQQINHGYDSILNPVQEYVKAGGSQGSSGFYANNGEKGDKGYNGYDAFQKGIVQKYNKNQDSGFYNDAAGHKKGHHDVGGHYGSFNVASKGENGGKFSEENSQKKGHKTTGYHKVYHKDEFKKEHSFYDEADKSGHFDKYGKGDSSFGLEKGAFQKGGHQDSAYHVGENGKKGYFDKGSSQEQDEGYKAEKGGNSQFNDNSEYGNKGGQNFQKSFGFGETGFEY